MLYVHDDVAQAEEVLRVQRLSEEVGKVVVRVDERHAKPMVLDALADVEVAPVDVLGLRVVLGVVCGISPSSKYTSDVVTTLASVGSQMSYAPGVCAARPRLMPLHARGSISVLL